MKLFRSVQRFFQRVRSFFTGLVQRRLFYEAYYVNGSDELPPPLSARRERELIEEMERGENVLAARNELVEHNLRLVVYIARRFDSSGYGLEDLVSIGTIGLIKGIASFRSEKNIRLATYASRCIENEILMFLRKGKNRGLEVSIDEPLNVDWDGNELVLGDVLGTDGDEVHRDLVREEDRQMLLSAVSRLSPRDKEIISLRFGLFGQREMTQKEVASELGISQSYISRLEKRILLKLKKDITAQS